MKWNNPADLEQLLIQLVSWESKTGTDGEIQFPYLLQEKLHEITYFKQHPSQIQLVDASQNRHALIATYKTDRTKDTIVLMSHFDTVHTKEYGALEQYACTPTLLEEALKKEISVLQEEVQNDLLSGAYLFGRGTMDMKMGLAMHMAIIEKASAEKWPINLILLTVPDEEVNSAGMRAAVQYLAQLTKEQQLKLKLFLNGEPSFSQKPHDPNYYIYTGTIGKLMPSILCYGVETHAGESLNGLNAHYVASFITKEMEWNDLLQEVAFGEKTPLPTCLKVIDLKTDYSTQTSHHVAAFYNVQVMRQTAADIMDTFKQIVQTALTKCEADYETICQKNNIQPIDKIKTITYDALLTYAREKIGEETVDQIFQNKDKDMDERIAVAKICDALMGYCKELAPAVVLFFAPPYYPAVNTSEYRVIQRLVTETKQLMQGKYSKQATQIHYFNGICDLSYVNYDVQDDGWEVYKENCPLWGHGYTVPFEAMQQLQAPVLNIGPYGKDAHKMTERLHKQSAFIETPLLVEHVIQSFLEN